MLNCTWEYSISELIINDKRIIWVKYPIDNIEIFIDTETKDIIHVFKCDSVIRPDKDFKHELKNKKKRDFYIKTALELLTI